MDLTTSTNIHRRFGAAMAVGTGVESQVKAGLLVIKWTVLPGLSWYVGVYITLGIWVILETILDIHQICLWCCSFDISPPLWHSLYLVHIPGEARRKLVYKLYPLVN